MSANKMIMCDMREDGHLHVMAFRHDGKVVADSFRINCMSKEMDFSIGKFVEFGDVKDLERFAMELILPCLLEAFQDVAKKLSPMPICVDICDMTIGREPPKPYGRIFPALVLLILAHSAIGATNIFRKAKFEYGYIEDGIRITRVIGATIKSGSFRMPGEELFFPDQIDGVDVVEISSNACNNLYTKGGSGFGDKPIRFPAKLKRLSEYVLQYAGGYATDARFYCRFPKTLEKIDCRFASIKHYPGTYDQSGMGVSIFDGPPPDFVGGFSSAGLRYGALGSGSSGARVYVSDLYYDDFVRKSQVDSWGTVQYYYHGALLCRGMPGLKILPEVDVLYEGNSLVSFTCTKSEAQIYYTLDGSEPQTNITAQCYKYDGPFPLSHPSRVRAIAIASDYPYEAIEEKFYSVDQPDMPEIRAVKDISFDATGFGVEIIANSTSGVIRYTTDDTEVTIDSPLYNGEFSISDTTIVRAKVFEAGRFASEETVVTFTREWYTVDAPAIEPSGAAFENVSQTVLLSCATDGATILYTTDGSDPKVNGREYTKPFTIYKTCTVRAIAVKYDWKDSAEATATFTRGESLSEAANFYGYTMETDSAAPWTVDAAVSHDGVSSVRSGAIGNNGTTYLMASVKKAGTVSFWWKAQSEEPDEDDGEDGYYDYGAFLVDDVVKDRIAGNDTGWRFVSVEVPTGGKHVLRWEYRKDGATSYAPDCVWVDQVQWSPADGSGYTLTSPEPVPYSWLRQYNLGVASGDFEAAANAASGKLNCGRPTEVWEEYVAGLDPTNANSQLKAKIKMQGETPIVTWDPNLNEDGVERRLYKVYGSETLENGGEWQYPTNSLHRFFKVMVEMP